MHQNPLRYFLSRFHAEESFEPIWKKEYSKARKLAPGENRIHDHPSSTARMLQPTSCWRLYGEQGRNLPVIITTPITISIVVDIQNLLPPTCDLYRTRISYSGN